MVPFQEKYQNIMVSVNDAMEHSNVSSFLQILFCVLILKILWLPGWRYLWKVWMVIRRRRRLASYKWRRPEFSILSNLRSNHRFDVHPPFPTCFLQTHKTTTAMTTGQFSGLLSILNLWLAQVFCATPNICCYER